MEHPSFDPEIEMIVDAIFQEPTDMGEVAEQVWQEYHSEKTTDVYSYLAQDIQDHIYSVCGKISEVIGAEILPLQDIVRAMFSEGAQLEEDERDDALSILLTRAAKRWYAEASPYQKAAIFGLSYDEEDVITYLASLLYEYIDPMDDAL